MIEKKLTLEIKGKPYELNFGINYFFEFYKNDSGHDLIKDPAFENIDLQSTQVFNLVQSLIWAGIKAEAALHDREVSEETREKIRKYVMGLDVLQTVELMNKITECIAGGKIEEKKS